MLFCVYSTNAQIKIEVVKIPILTQKDAKIYIAGTFNNWQTNDPKSELKKNEDGTYTIELPDTLSNFEYKFTRGSWDMVEGNFNGMRPNRVYDKSKNKGQKHIVATIESWEDYFHYTIEVTKLPKNTPHDASIYIAGNFNDWNPGYANYKLNKLKDGTYRVSIYSTLEKIQYKFTRGTWSSVEGRENGRAILNRVLHRDRQINHVIQNEITVGLHETQK